MRYIFLLSLFFLAACVNTKQIDLDAIQTTNDFALAKRQAFAKFHKNCHLDVPWAKGPESVAELSLDLSNIKNKLEKTIPNTSLTNLEETDLLALFVASFNLDGNFFHFFLYGIQKHDSLKIEMSKYDEIGENDLYEEKVLAQAINYDHTLTLISLLNETREDKDIMTLYTKYLLVKYGFNSRSYELSHLQMRTKQNKNEWLSKEKSTFLAKYPETQYKAFMEQWSL